MDHKDIDSRIHDLLFNKGQVNAKSRQSEDDPQFPHWMWKLDVAFDTTELGYWDWVSYKKDELAGKVKRAPIA